MARRSAHFFWRTFLVWCRDLRLPTACTCLRADAAGRGRRPVLVAIATVALICAVADARTQRLVSAGNTAAVARPPTVSLSKASTLRFTGDVDSNSPAFWDSSTGQWMLHLFTSWGGEPRHASGTDLVKLGDAQAVRLILPPQGNNWIEAVVQDVDGTLYGYYHNERPATMCPGSDKVVPRIGALRSADRGLTWRNLGTILEAPQGTFDCETPNHYFVGGVGDFSVMLDADAKDLYVFYTAYLRPASLQGVGVARLAWADRDRPVGKITVWQDGIWLPARVVGGRWTYPAATPVYPAVESWHDGNTSVDAFWGPSVHWNTYLEQYVMLLNRAVDSGFADGGIYVAFAPRLDDPSLWSLPTRILKEGSWYPQVMGLEPRTGTDKVAGEWARLFLTGRSDYLIHFSK